MMSFEEFSATDAHAIDMDPVLDRRSFTIDPNLAGSTLSNSELDNQERRALKSSFSNAGIEIRAMRRALEEDVVARPLRGSMAAKRKRSNVKASPKKRALTMHGLSTQKAEDEDVEEGPEAGDVEEYATLFRREIRGYMAALTDLWRQQQNDPLYSIHQEMLLVAETFEAGIEELKKSAQARDVRLAKLEQQMSNLLAGNVPLTFQVTPQGVHYRQVATYGNYGPPISIDQRLSPRQVHTSGPDQGMSMDPCLLQAQSHLLESASSSSAGISIPHFSPPQIPDVSRLPSQFHSPPMSNPSSRRQQPEPKAPRHMCNWNLSTVSDIWREWNEGTDGMPSIVYLNQHHPTWRCGWQRKDIVKFSKRKQIIDAINRRAGGRIPVLDVVQEFTLAMQNETKTINQVWQAIVQGEKDGIPWPRHPQPAQ